MKETSKIFVAGHRGMVGSAIVRNLESHLIDQFRMFIIVTYSLLHCFDTLLIELF